MIAGRQKDSRKTQAAIEIQKRHHLSLFTVCNILNIKSITVRHDIHASVIKDAVIDENMSFLEAFKSYPVNDVPVSDENPLPGIAFGIGDWDAAKLADEAATNDLLDSFACAKKDPALNMMTAVEAEKKQGILHINDMSTTEISRRLANLEGILKSNLEKHPISSVLENDFE